MKKIIIACLSALLALAILAGGLRLILNGFQGELSSLGGNNTFSFTAPYQNGTREIPVRVTSGGNLTVKFGSRSLLGSAGFSITDGDGKTVVSRNAINGQFEITQPFEAGAYTVSIQFKRAFPSSAVFSLSLCATESATYLCPVNLNEREYQRVSENDGEGFHWPYYLYTPRTLTRGARHTILVAPNNSGFVSDDFSVHEEQAKVAISSLSRFADTLGCPLLVPVFPRWEKTDTVYTHALDRDTLLIQGGDLERIDLQLIAMIDDARRLLGEKGLETDDRVFMYGFSASGMFTNRFTLLHPDRIRAASIGSPGGWPIAPVPEYGSIALPYPVGAFDIAELTGIAPDFEEFNKLPLLFYLGGDDDNDSVPFSDSYDDAHRELIDGLFGKTPVERWPVAEKIYAESGCAAEFRLYGGVGHTVSGEMEADILAFFRKNAD